MGLEVFTFTAMHRAVASTTSCIMLSTQRSMPVCMMPTANVTQNGATMANSSEVDPRLSFARFMALLDTNGRGGGQRGRTGRPSEDRRVVETRRDGDDASTADDGKCRCWGRLDRQARCRIHRRRDAAAAADGVPRVHHGVGGARLRAIVHRHRGHHLDADIDEAGRQREKEWKKNPHFDGGAAILAAQEVAELHILLLIATCGSS